MLAVLILMALRYKRKKGSLRSIWGAPGGSATRAITTGGDGGGSGNAMAESSGAAGVAAAFAKLSGKHTAPAAAAPEAGERGFYRVSGRKLPSVLTAGGDGYTDPRESYLSGHSDYWRGSQSFEPSQGTSTRLALGSPMRPVSGVPIMRPSPGRTPIARDNPFADPLPRPSADGVGRSMPGEDGSRGSGSRFQERL